MMRESTEEHEDDAEGSLFGDSARATSMDPATAERQVCALSEIYCW